MFSESDPVESLNIYCIYYYSFYYSSSPTQSPSSALSSSASYCYYFNYGYCNYYSFYISIFDSFSALTKPFSQSTCISPQICSYIVYKISFASNPTFLLSAVLFAWKYSSMTSSERCVLNTKKSGGNSELFL